jgi:hypothetical protein
MEKIKISFLFLTQKELTQSNIWFDYFKGINNDLYSIYVHSKPDFNHSNFFNYQIESIPTKWGSFSLIDAQQLLLNKSLDDKDNNVFIFISETTIPITNFETFYKFISENNNKSIFYSEKCSINNHCNRINTINNIHNWGVTNWYINPQWVLFNREHATFLKNNFLEIKNIFENSNHPEEHAYSTFMEYKNVINDKNYLNKDLTFVDWFGFNGTYPSSYFTHDINDDFLNDKKNNGFFS